MSIILMQKKLHVVMDNFGTHKAGSLYKTLPPKEALRIANWETLHCELAARKEKRNNEKALISWQFAVEAAREKFTRAYEEAMS
jgi:hypothetical protein